MSLTCPKCGLFSPAEALRCDCGYDFATQEIRPSYLAAHVVQKHGGAGPFLETQARRNIVTGFCLLGVGATMFGIGYVISAREGSGGSYIIPWGAVFWGLVSLTRGFNQRNAAARSTRW